MVSLRLMFLKGDVFDKGLLRQNYFLSPFYELHVLEGLTILFHGLIKNYCMVDGVNGIYFNNLKIRIYEIL